MDKMTQKERLLEFIEFLKMGQNKFEKTVGLATGNIAHWDMNVPPKAQAKIYAAFPELNHVWLLTGVGEMLKEVQPEEEPSTPAVAVVNDTREQELLQSTIAALRETIEAQKLTIQALSDQVAMLKAHGTKPF